MNGTRYLGALAAGGGVDRVAMRAFPLLPSKNRLVFAVCQSPLSRAVTNAGQAAGKNSGN
jgi:hypothetical protein